MREGDVSAPGVAYLQLFRAYLKGLLRNGGEPFVVVAADASAPGNASAACAWRSTSPQAWHPFAPPPCGDLRASRNPIQIRDSSQKTLDF